MTINQVARYTALVKRRSELCICSGISWKPEYEKELYDIDTEIMELRRGMKMCD